MKTTCLLCSKHVKVTNASAAHVLSLFPSAPYACSKCVKKHGELGVQHKLLAIMRDKCAFSVN